VSRSASRSPARVRFWNRVSILPSRVNVNRSANPGSVTSGHGSRFVVPSERRPTRLCVGARTTNWPPWNSLHTSGFPHNALASALIYSGVALGKGPHVCNWLLDSLPAPVVGGILKRQRQHLGQTRLRGLGRARRISYAIWQCKRYGSARESDRVTLRSCKNRRNDQGSTTQRISP
jgi:hypothetical protein